MLKNVRLFDLVGAAGLLGVAAGLMGLTLTFKQRRKIKETSYYKKALQTLNENKVAVELIGKPIEVDHIDLSDARNLFALNSARFVIPLNGTKNKAELFVWADGDGKGADGEQELRLKKLEMRLFGTLAHKRFIIYNRNDN